MVRKVDCFEDVFAKVMQELVRYACPLAEHHVPKPADRHKSKHSGIRYPCPLAEQYHTINVHGHSHARTVLVITKKTHAESHIRYPAHGGTSINAL